MTYKERKFYNELHYAIKGHLINLKYSDAEVKRIGDSYLKRLWGNHERLSYCREDFEERWYEQERQLELDKVAVLGYD
jgi:hypothetical protein